MNVTVPSSSQISRQRDACSTEKMYSNSSRLIGEP